jgi:putative heme-binding domain-containing protein
VGPELGAIGASAPLDYIIESLIVPGAKVKEGFNGVSFTMKDGTLLAGVLARESAAEFVVRTAAGVEQAVPKASVTARDNIGSLMPAGLTQQLKPRELQDLVAFLAQLGKAGAYDASKATVARTWWLTGADTSHPLPVFTNVDGTLPQDRLTALLPLLQGEKIQAAAKLTTTVAARSRFTLAGIREASLDGKALPVASEPNPTVALTPGEHTLVITLDPKSLPPAIRAEAEGVRFTAE